MPQKPRPALDRFMEKVCMGYGGSCWMWTGYLNAGTGYARFTPHHSIGPVSGHRWSYEYFRGRIPAGLTIDHLCRVRACVNPDHMEVVTMGINSLRGNSPPAINARKTHCQNGHPFLGSARVCVACRNAAARAKYCEHRRNYLDKRKSYYWRNRERLIAHRRAYEANRLCAMTKHEISPTRLPTSTACGKVTA